MGLSTDVILQPIALLLLAALSKSILLVASSSRQLNNSIAAFGSGGMLTEYEFPSRHGASQTSSSTEAPLNNVRMTRSHCALLSRSRRVKVSFRWSSLSPNNVWLTLFCAAACDAVTAHTRKVNSGRIIGFFPLKPRLPETGSRPELGGPFILKEGQFLGNNAIVDYRRTSIATASTFEVRGPPSR